MASVVEKIGETNAEISREVLRDKLSEFLAVERSGIALYTEALRLVFDREVSGRFKAFREQTREHERILLRMIEALGMDTGFMSPCAVTTQQKAEALLKTMTAARGLTGRMAELNAIENVVLAETKDRADWEFLEKVARQCEDPKLREILQSAVAEVESQEDEHLNWTVKQLARLAFTDVQEKVPQPRKRKHKTPRNAHPARSERVAKDKPRKKVGATRTRTTKSAKGHKQKRKKSAQKKISRG
jgi:rubrerythrin